MLKGILIRGNSTYEEMEVGKRSKSMKKFDDLVYRMYEDFRKFI